MSLTSAVPPTVQPTAPGYLVAGRYRIKSRIGTGGMSSVWLATDQLLKRPVALKQIFSTSGMAETEAADCLELALHEGRIAAKLAHRNAIAMYDIAIEAGQPWLVMEYLPSHSVTQILSTTGTFTAQQTAQLGAQVAAALAQAHSEGIVHRDVKPGNILIGNQGINTGLIKITDFGISWLAGEKHLQPSGNIIGTPAYFAPEIARGNIPTPAADVFSLGGALYCCAEGRPPFGFDKDVNALMKRVSSGKINQPKISGPLVNTLLAALEPAPANRPSMNELRDELALLAADALCPPHEILSAPFTTHHSWARTSAADSPYYRPADAEAPADNSYLNFAEPPKTTTKKRLGTSGPKLSSTSYLASQRFTRVLDNPKTVNSGLLVIAGLLLLLALILVISIHP